jgi:hypothetical protein
MVVEVSDDRYLAGRERTTMNLHLSTSQLKPEVGESTHVLQVQGEGHTPVTFRVISMNILRIHTVYMLDKLKEGGRSL